MRCVEFRARLLLGIRKHLSPWQLKAAVQVILNTFLVTHVWADAIYARLLQLLCIQVCVYIYIYTLPSLKLLPALLFALLSKLIACTVFLHLWSVVVPSICLALRQSYKGSLWKGQVVLMKYITGYLLVGFETSGILGWDWSKPKSDVN